MNNDKTNHHLPVSLLHKWIVELKSNDSELGRLIRGYYWDVRDELKNEK